MRRPSPLSLNAAAASAAAAAAAAPDAQINHDPFIAKKLEDGSHLDLLIHRQANIVHDVDFQHNTVRQVYSSNQYTIYFTNSINKKRPVTCLFPNHKTENKQVLESKSFFSLASFNKALNEALEASRSATDAVGAVRLAVCYGKHIFVCKHITDTVYIIWASHINRMNVGNVANTPFQNVPVLINMDGQARVKAMFILKASVSDESDLDRLPVTEDNPKIMFHTKTPLFVCEVKPPTMARRDLVQTVTRKEALAAATAPTRTTPAMYKRERNPFAASIDMEEVYGSDPDGGTPRPDQLYMKDVMIGGGGRGGAVDKTPPIVRSDGEVEDDPFEEIVV